MNPILLFHGDGQPVGAPSDAPVWIQIAKQGAFAGHSAGPFKMDLRTFGEIITNFKATVNRAIPIDYEHASEMDATSGSIPTHGAPAQGWIRDLKIEGGNLFGLVEWLPQARDQIRAGQYKFLSPAIRFDSKDRVTGKPIGARLSSAALTNEPFLDGMQPLAAKDVEAHRHLTDLELTSIRSCRECCDKLMDDDGGDAAMKLRDSMGRAASAELLQRNAEQTILAKDQTIALRDSEIVELKAEIDKRDHADRTARVELAFATWKDVKKLNAADREAMAFLCASKRDVFERAFPIIEAEHAHLLRTVPPEARPRREGPMSFEEASEGGRR